MKNRTGIIVLILICAGLAIGLIWSQKSASDQRTTDTDRIGGLSNELKSTTFDLVKQREVNTQFEILHSKQKEAIAELTNRYTETSATLDKTAATLKTTQEQMAKEVAQRDAKISELEAQNQALDQRAVDLSTSITNLTTQIADTQKKLSASEGDKAFLEKELQRLMTEKAELERQFNDLKVLRTQVAKLKEELNISRRIEWIRKGLFATDQQKGAERLMRLSSGSASSESKPEAKKPNFDLNVEVSSDGTIRVIQPGTNSPAATNQPPVK